MATNPFSIDTASNSIAAAVTMTTGGTFYDGGSVSLTAGTWFVSGNVSNLTTTAGTTITKIYAGSTIYRAAERTTTSSGIGSHSLSAIITLDATTTVKIGAANDVNGGSVLADPTGGSAHVASGIVAIKLA